MKPWSHNETNEKNGVGDHWSNFDIIVAFSREYNDILRYKLFHDLFMLEKFNYSVFIYNERCAKARQQTESCLVVFCNFR